MSSEMNAMITSAANSATPRREPLVTQRRLRRRTHTATESPRFPLTVALESARTTVRVCARRSMRIIETIRVSATGDANGLAGGVEVLKHESSRRRRQKRSAHRLHRVESERRRVPVALPEVPQAVGAAIQAVPHRARDANRHADGSASAMCPRARATSRGRMRALSLNSGAVAAHVPATSSCSSRRDAETTPRPNRSATGPTPCRQPRSTWTRSHSCPRRRSPA